MSAEVEGVRREDGSSPGRRTSNRAEVTREAILDAARVVFVAEGYVDTSIAAVVEAAGASVGSLYHHFGGKADVFLALHQRYETATWKSATEAVAAAREAGQLDPVELFLVGARAYLVRCRLDADLTVLFLEGDGPPGFVKLRRDASGEWVRQNSRLIRAEERRNGEALVYVLTTIAGTAGREVAAAATDQRAEELLEDFLELLRRTATPPT